MPPEHLMTGPPQSAADHPHTDTPFVFTTVQALRAFLCLHFEDGSNFHQGHDGLYANIPELCGLSGRTRVPRYEEDLNAVQRLITRLRPQQREPYLALLSARTQQQHQAGLEPAAHPALTCALTRALALADLVGPPLEAR